MSSRFRTVFVPMYPAWYFIFNLRYLMGFLCIAAATVGAAAEYAQFLRLGNVNMRIEGYMSTFTGVSSTNCLARCELVDKCFFISYHGDQNVCQLHEINKTATHETGWTMHYKVRNETGKTHMDLMVGANASQPDTFSDVDGTHHANLALDGNTGTVLRDLSCSHTEATPTDTSTYWIMQFGMAGVVAKVEMYLRSDYTSRNSNRVVLVALSYEDAVDDVGMECGSYFGPVIDQSPYILTIHCNSLLYGSFLRITRLSDTEPNMELCEVRVDPP